MLNQPASQFWFKVPAAVMLPVRVPLTVMLGVRIRLSLFTINRLKRLAAVVISNDSLLPAVTAVWCRSVTWPSVGSPGIAHSLMRDVWEVTKPF